MKQSIKQILFTTLALALLLAACAPAPAPTPDPTEIANQVATSVALTVASQNLETAQAQPPATETSLPTETATVAVVDTPTAIPPVDTATPLPLPTSASSGGGGGGGSSANNDYACNVTFRRPSDNTVYRPNTKFDVKWTIENTGNRVIRAGTDLKFNSGTQMITGTNRVELPELDPGEEFDVDFDAVTPSKEGDYVMTYIVEGGLCYPYVVIKVEK